MSGNNRETISDKKINKTNKAKTTGIIKGILPAVIIIFAIAEHLLIPNKQVVSTTGVYNKVLIASLI